MIRIKRHWCSAHRWWDEAWSMDNALSGSWSRGVVGMSRSWNNQAWLLDNSWHGDNTWHN